jgi:anti-sigma B factor antagonist
MNPNTLLQLNMMEVTIENREPNIVITLNGEIDMSNVGELTSALEESLDNQHEVVTLDLDGVGYCDSAGLSMFLTLQRSLVRRQQQLVLLLSLGHSLRRVMEITNLDKIFTIEEPTAGPVETPVETPV